MLTQRAIFAPFSLAPSPPDDFLVYQYGVSGLVVLFWHYQDYLGDTTYSLATLTEFIIYYQQQGEGERLSKTIESNFILSWDWRYIFQKDTISGLMGGATYSVSVVAVSFTLHSDETTAVNIIIGTVTVKHHLIIISCIMFFFCRVSSNIDHLPSFLNCWEYCQSHLLYSCALSRRLVYPQF